MAAGGPLQGALGRICAVTTEIERCELECLISREVSENSTLVAYTDNDGEWVDVEPDWEEPERWT